MSIALSTVNTTIKVILRLICRIDAAALNYIPQTGPLILVANHVNFLEVPLVFTHLQPRPVTGFAKAETWDNPVMRQLFNLWKAIPLERGEADIQAMRQALKVLENYGILAIAPEGTRSGDGKLRKGHPGVVTLALLSGSPILPLVYYGGEQLGENIRRLRRTDFKILVGRTFTLDTKGVKVTRLVRQQMVDEIMYQLAALLPPAYHGYYKNLNLATTNFLQFLPDSDTQG